MQELFENELYKYENSGSNKRLPAKDISVSNLPILKREPSQQELKNQQ